MASNSISQQQPVVAPNEPDDNDDNNNNDNNDNDNDDDDNEGDVGGPAVESHINLAKTVGM